VSFKFEESLAKGKIAEVIFEEMFHSQGKFEVLHHGFEYTSPEIAQKLQDLDRETFEKIRHQPDFILVSWDKKRAVFSGSKI